MPVAGGWLLLAAVAGAAAAPTRMAVLPAGTVSGVDELLEVYEELMDEKIAVIVEKLSERYGAPFAGSTTDLWSLKS